MIDGKDFTCTGGGAVSSGGGCIEIDADDVVVRRSRVRADSDDPNSHDSAGIYVKCCHTGIVIEDNEITSYSDSHAGDASWCPECIGRGIIDVGGGTAARRNYIHKTTTGVIFSSDSLYEYNYIGEMESPFDDPSVSDDAHASAIGSGGGDSNVTVRYNRATCGAAGININCSRSMLLYEDFGTNDHIIFEGNRLAANAEYCATTGQGHGGNHISWTHNRFSTEINSPLCGASGECDDGSGSDATSSSTDNRFLVGGGGGVNQNTACEWP